jgi:hypothetical protein
MMGERRVIQEALFYGFSLERHVPDDHLLRKIDRFVDLSGLRAFGASAVQGGPPQSCLSLVSLGGHGLSTPLFSAGQVGSARKGSGFFACSTLGGVGGQDGLRRVGRPSFATRPAGKCRTVATSDAGSSNPRPLPGTPFRLVGGTRGFCLCASLKLRSVPPFGSCRTTGSQFRRSTYGA